MILSTVFNRYEALPSALGAREVAARFSRLRTTILGQRDDVTKKPKLGQQSLVSNVVAM